MNPLYLSDCMAIPRDANPLCARCSRPTWLGCVHNCGTFSICQSCRDKETIKEIEMVEVFSDYELYNAPKPYVWEVFDPAKSSAGGIKKLIKWLTRWI